VWKLTTDRLALLWLFRRVLFHCQLPTLSGSFLCRFALAEERELEAAE
jgi:hypothetical protein